MSAEALERGRALLAQGKSGEAVLLLQQALAYGGGPQLQAMLGYALYHNGRIGEAEVALVRAADLHPGEAVIQEALARVLWMGGAGMAFADNFIAAVNAHPADADMRFRCAELLHLSGLNTRAEALLRDGLARDPSNARLASTLGVLLDETGRFDEALRINAAVAQAHPRALDLLLNLAHTLLRAGKTDEAMRAIAAIRRADPDMQLAITYEGMALKQAGDPRHDWLCNYQQHVQAFDIEAPSGFSSVKAFNEELAAILRSLMDAEHHPLEQSLRGGSQTSDNLVLAAHPLLQQYFRVLEAPVRAYIDSLGNDRNHPLEGSRTGRFAFSGCWSVLLRPGGFHVNHTHPAGWISSAYYVSLPPVMSADSQEGWIKFGEPRWPVPGCGIERVTQPLEGRLVLFPSYMWHGTIPFSSGERLTAPFDVVPA